MGIILSANLQGYFFESLSELNKKSLCPVPESIIYYSSEVLDRFSLSQDYFEISDGKVRHKILGTKILEAMSLTREEQKRTYKEVGDMSLMLCGYFSESINKKMVDTQYYSQLGRMAYSHLNSLDQRFLDIPSFYGMVATSFESLSVLLTMLANKDKVYQKMLNGELSEKEMLAAGIIPTR